MKHRIVAWGLLTATACLFLISPTAARRAPPPRAHKLFQEKKEKKDKPPVKKAKAPPAEGAVNKLALEVMALRGLSEFEPSLKQLVGLKKMYDPSFVTKQKIPAGKASKKYVNNLRKLRDAYVANDEDDIEEFSNKVEVLEEEEEELQVVDEIRPSLPAAKAAREALRLFSAKQVLEVLDAYGDDLPGPVSALMDALEEGVDSKGKQWDDERNAAAFKAAWLGFGMVNALANNPRAKKAYDDSVKWLNDNHGLGADAIEKQRDKLATYVREKIFERANPADVIRNIAVHDMAVLLANPELTHAIDKRIKAEKERKE
jgi:hypothetical protein